MSESRIRPLKPSHYIALIAVAFVAGVAGVWAIAGDDNGTPSATQPPTPASPTEAASTATRPGLGEEAGAGEVADSGASRAERAVTRTVRRYVEAISDRDGATVCELVPGATRLDLPESGGSCAASVSASIGYRDPRGFPVFEKAVLAGDPAIEIDGSTARATATVVSEFADREEASVEDDVIYLERSGAGWLIAKPSSTLYRAIGTPDIPPDVLTPPE